MSTECKNNHGKPQKNCRGESRPGKKLFFWLLDWANARYRHLYPLSINQVKMFQPLSQPPSFSLNVTISAASMGINSTVRAS